MRDLILSGNNSTQLNRITLNFIFLLIPAIFLIYYVYSLIVCYKYFYFGFKFLKINFGKKRSILNAFYKYFNYRGIIL